MHDILVFLLDRESIDEIQNFFKGENYRVTIIDKLEDAADACRQELFDMALVWPAQPEKTADFITLLDANQFKYMPIVAVTRDEKQMENLFHLPIADLIKLPLPRLEFFYLLERVVEDIDVHATVVEGTNWQGSVTEYNLIDLIQMMEAGQRNETLIMRVGKHTGNVFFREGQLVNASFNGLSGFPALQKLAFWQKGQFQTKADVDEAPAEDLGKSNHDILIDLISILHKQEQVSEGLPALDDDILKNPLTTIKHLTPLQEKIVKLCETSTSLFQLLLALPESNEDIFLELKLLLKMNLVGKRSDIEAQIKEKEDGIGFGKFFSDLFRKKPAIEEGYYVYEGYIEEAEPYQLIIPDLKLSAADLQKLESKIDGII